ncbi:unnamed protein product [Diplocarpon coronariae]|uniref:Uncharacterized protein n=1 Tax=Diplocarpon coronariae TaxID=2795749 RepID=A0A218Z479_9HELO|nr:hypothetical protein JHW43_002183 [Diplocarpon mali]OWP02901.1 hypothetical protein B2J93_3481 [Marssonina coronariae]
MEAIEKSTASDLPPILASPCNAGDGTTTFDSEANSFSASPHQRAPASLLTIDLCVRDAIFHHLCAHRTISLLDYEKYPAARSHSASDRASNVDPLASLRQTCKQLERDVTSWLGNLRTVRSVSFAGNFDVATARFTTDMINTSKCTAPFLTAWTNKVLRSTIRHLIMHYPPSAVYAKSKGPRMMRLNYRWLGAFENLKVIDWTFDNQFKFRARAGLICMIWQAMGFCRPSLRCTCCVDKAPLVRWNNRRGGDGSDVKWKVIPRLSDAQWTTITGHRCGCTSCRGVAYEDEMTQEDIDELKGLEAISDDEDDK